MPNTSQNYIATWEEVYDAAETVIIQVKEYLGTVERIVAVEKGGIIAAGLILQAFPKASFNSLRCESYHSPGVAKKPMLTKGLNFAPFNNPNTLIVDEICDSGETFSMLHGYMPQATFACLWVRDKCPVTPLIYGSKVGKGVWIDFPWEQLSPPVPEEPIPF